eukprot:jgi/Botrbrau1/9028/Bobra.0376s0005.1
MAKPPPLKRLTGLECIKYKINIRNLILFPNDQLRSDHEGNENKCVAESPLFQIHKACCRKLPLC